LTPAAYLAIFLRCRLAKHRSCGAGPFLEGFIYRTSGDVAEAFAIHRGG